MTRYLTQEEIQKIVSFVPLNKHIPSEISIQNRNDVVSEIVKDLKDIQIYPQMIPKLARMIEKKYNESLIQSGEMVGILCAQSIGEKQTQSTLNTFHKAGSSTQTLSTGVSRFSELINTYKEPKHKVMRLYPLLKSSNIQHVRDFIGSDIVEIKVGDIIEHISFVENTDQKQWESFFYDIYSEEFYPHGFDSYITLECHVNMDKLFEYKIDLEYIAKKINDSYDELNCIFSPDNIGMLKLFIDNKTELFDCDDDSRNMMSRVENNVLPQVKDLHVCGIKGISDLYFLKDNDGCYFFETKGSNFVDSIVCKKIDTSRIYSNNIWEIYETLGIEATRQFLIDEFMDIMSGINLCHVKILVDRMTFSGNVNSVSRYTMRKDDCGPLTKASFEETLDTFIKASVFGKKETTQGVSSAIICGKKSNIGTGMCTLQIDFKKLSNRNNNENKDITRTDVSTEKKNTKQSYLHSKQTSQILPLSTLKDLTEKQSRGRVYIGSFKGKGKRSVIPEHLKDKPHKIVNVTTSQPKTNINRLAFSTMNPVEGSYKGYYCFEHYWQSGKVFEGMNEDDCKKWFKKQTKPKSYWNKTKGKSLLYFTFPDIFGDTKLDIVSSRKKVYVPEYHDLVKDHEQTKQLKNDIENGMNIIIYDTNGPIDNDTENPITLEVTQELLKNKINDVSGSFGHGYVLGACLLNIDPETYTN